MQSGTKGKLGDELIPESGGARSEPERDGIKSGADQTILKVTGLRFPAPDTEVEEKPRRRKFKAAYKLKILREADQCTERGELGALLRREGLYHSHIQKWRQMRSHDELKSLTERKRGRKPKPQNPLAKENLQLKRETERLQRELKKAHIIIDVQKKISDLLGIDQPPIDLEKIK